MGRTGLEANRRLAELLGWANIFDVGGALIGTPPAGALQCREQARVPDWSGDWRDCGPLIVEHLYSLCLTKAFVTARASKGFGLMRQRGAGDDATARRLIVDAVIAKLEEAR